jgi:uncharacterized protein YuzE
MKVQFFPDTSTLAISFADRPAAATDEIAEGFLVERDAAGSVVGIVIDDTRTIPGFDPSVIVSVPQGAIS